MEEFVIPKDWAEPAAASLAGTHLPQPARADVLFLGDVCFGASYGREMLERRGLDAPFARLDGLLQRADYVIANLETTLTTERSSPMEGKKRHIHRDDPEAVEALRKHGIDAVSLANNHAFDFGAPGLSETLRALQSSGIRAFGAGLTAVEASRALVFQPSPQRTSFRLAVAAGKEGVSYRYHYYASENEAGVNRWTRNTAASQIQSLREAEPNAFLVAFPHWGRNYKWKIGYQTKLARSMIRAGADLVIGHGAHCIQEIDRIDGCWVLYSIGNSVFSTPGRYQKCPEVLPYSIIARLRVLEKRSGRDVSLRLYPILSDNRRTRYSPRLAKRSEIEEIREQLIGRSEESDRLGDVLSVGADGSGRYLSLPISHQ